MRQQDIGHHETTADPHGETARALKSRKVVLVTHDASLSGAPRIALLVASLLQRNGQRVEIISRSPGPMAPAFSALARFRVEPFYRVRRHFWRIPGMAPLALVLDTVLATISLAIRRPDLVYINSTAAVLYLRPALWLGLPVILHSHESGTVARQFTGPARSETLLARARLIACAVQARDDLADLAGIDPDRVVILPSVPDAGRILRLASEPCQDDLDAPGLLVGCCGTVEHRKGVDLWMAMIAFIRAERPDLKLRFVWIGPVRDPLPPAEEGVTFLGARSNPFPLMAGLDVFTQPSRDDQFPLSVLEAMTLGIPVVAFDVGGVADQVGDGGLIVPAGDVRALTDAVIRLVDDATFRRDAGERARARAARLCSTEAFERILTDVIGSFDRG